MLNAASAKMAKYRNWQKNKVSNPHKWRNTQSDEITKSRISEQMLSEESAKLGEYKTKCAEVVKKEGNNKSKQQINLQNSGYFRFSPTVDGKY